MPVNPEYRLDGKVAFLAGEGDGITPTLAGALAEAGAKVFILGPHQTVVEGAMMEVAKLGGQSLGLFGEPSDPTSVERAWRPSCLSGAGWTSSSTTPGPPSASPSTR